TLRPSIPSAMRMAPVVRSRPGGRGHADVRQRTGCREGLIMEEGAETTSPRVATRGRETSAMRTKFIAGNWKMFTTAATARQLAAAVAQGVTAPTVRVAVCPPFPYLATVADALRGSAVALGAQNCYPAKEGAF